MKDMKDWYIKQIKWGLPMKVTLDNGREFIILSVTGSSVTGDDNLICKTKHKYETNEYAIEQNFNDFWDKITNLSPKFYS